MNFPNITGIPIFLIIFVSATISIQIMLRRNKNGFKNSVDKFMETEKLADKTYKRNFTDFPYIYPDKNVLPFKQYEDKPEFKTIIKKQSTCRKKSELEMIYFEDEYSNTDLKLNYGKNNLDKITLLEEHYNSYIRSLLDWAEELLRLENKKDARIVLEEAVRMNSDVSRIYMHLADIYAEERNISALHSLAEKAEKTRINFKEKTMAYIKAKA